MVMAFPVGQGSPPEPGQMVFLGASSVSAATATCQESLDLSSSQEAMKGEGFGEAETLLGAGNEAPREGTRPRFLVYTSVPCPLCLAQAQFPVSASSAPPVQPTKPHQEASLDHPHLIPLLLFCLHISFIWVLLPPPPDGG